VRTFAVLLTASLLTGCGATIYGVRVPLVERSKVAVTDAPNIVIEDLRPAAERKVHTGGGMARCERWYGDDTYIPSKLAYLEQLLAERIPQGVTVQVQLRRFDTVEYCDDEAHAAGAGAVAGATGGAVVMGTGKTSGGSRVVVRLAGKINGAKFDSSRSFDYGDLIGWTMAANNPKYRERMVLAITEIVDDIAATVPAPKNHSR
jgi:hypothetical protein